MALDCIQFKQDALISITNIPTIFPKYERLYSNNLPTKKKINQSVNKSTNILAKLDNKIPPPLAFLTVKTIVT